MKPASAMPGGRALLACALLVAAVFAAFAPALRAGLVNWDDAELLLGNPNFRGWTRENVAWMATTNHAGPFQPLTWLSYALDHSLWGFEDRLDAPAARGFHLTNVVLHALTACAVFALARRLLGGVAVAFAAALLFALHPLRVESVAWVTERRDVLYGFLLVSSALAWLRWRDSLAHVRPRRLPALVAALASGLALLVLLASTAGPAGPWLRFEFEPAGVIGALVLLAVAAAAVVRAYPGARGGAYLLALGLFVLSLLAKASGMTFAAALVLAEVGVLRRGWRDAWAEKLPFAAAGAAFGALAYLGQAAQPQAVASWSDHTLLERALQACFGLVFYVKSSLWPVDLLVLHEVPRTIAPSDLRFALAALAVGMAVVLAWLIRRRAPGVVTALALYALLVAPMLGLAQCGPQLVADRYSYVPTIPLALLAAAGLFRVFSLRSALAVAGVAAVGLGAATSAQCGVWQDSETLWRSALARGEESAIARTGLAEALRERAFAATAPEERLRLFEDARQHYEAALRLETVPRTACNAAVVELELAALDPDRAVERRERALALARRALAETEASGSSPSQARLVAGIALCQLERWSEASAELALHLDLDPASAIGWSHAGLALLEAGRPADAVPALRRSVELRPDERGARWHLALALERSGDRDAAREQYGQVLRLAPGHAGAQAALERLAER